MKKKTLSDVASSEEKKPVSRSKREVLEPKAKRTSSAKKAASTRGSQSAPSRSEANAVDPLSDLGTLPRTYGEEMIYLVAQDPHWLFTYWDIDISRHPGGPCFLRVEDASGFLEQQIEVPFETRNWYIPVKNAGGSYSVEIGFQRHGKWNSLCRSAIATTPRDRFSESAAFDFATLPMHISFQRLVETVSTSLASSDELLPALAKLQTAMPKASSSGFSLESRDREILQALLGSEILAGISSGQWNSEHLHSAITQRIRESLSSAEVEEFFSRLPEWNSESALFSGFQKLSAELAGSSSWIGSAAFGELLVRLGQLGGESSLFSAFQRLSAELAGSSSWAGSSAFGELLGRLERIREESSLFSGFQKLSAELAESSAWTGSAAFAELLVRFKEYQSASSLFSQFQSSSAALGSSSNLLGSAVLAEMLAFNLSSWFTGMLTGWSGASENFKALEAASSWSGSELSSASEFAARSALASWLSVTASSWIGSELSVQALAAISSWSSEIMASQGSAVGSWSASSF